MSDPDHEVGAVHGALQGPVGGAFGLGPLRRRVRAGAQPGLDGGEPFACDGVGDRRPSRTTPRCRCGSRAGLRASRHWATELKAVKASSPVTGSRTSSISFRPTRSRASSGPRCGTPELRLSGERRMTGPQAPALPVRWCRWVPSCEHALCGGRFHAPVQGTAGHSGPASSACPLELRCRPCVPGATRPGAATAHAPRPSGSRRGRRGPCRWPRPPRRAWPSPEPCRS